jgi:hypothetical protein
MSSGGRQLQTFLIGRGFHKAKLARRPLRPR